MAAFNVKYRDVRYALPFMIQIWMFTSPVIYPVPDKWRWLLSLNPMTGIIEGFRTALLGQPLNWATLGLSGVLSIGLLLCATLFFTHMEKNFADVI